MAHSFPPGISFVRRSTWAVALALVGVGASCHRGAGPQQGVGDASAKPDPSAPANAPVVTTVLLEERRGADTLTVTPLVRLFKGPVLLEAGYSSNDEPLFNLTYRF